MRLLRGWDQNCYVAVLQLLAYTFSIPFICFHSLNPVRVSGHILFGLSSRWSVLKFLRLHNKWWDIIYILTIIYEQTKQKFIDVWFNVNWIANSHMWPRFMLLTFIHNLCVVLFCLVAWTAKVGHSGFAWLCFRAHFTIVCCKNSCASQPILFHTFFRVTSKSIKFNDSLVEFSNSRVCEGIDLSFSMKIRCNRRKPTTTSFSSSYSLRVLRWINNLKVFSL